MTQDRTKIAWREEEWSWNAIRTPYIITYFMTSSANKSSNPACLQRWSYWVGSGGKWERERERERDIVLIVGPSSNTHRQKRNLHKTRPASNIVVDCNCKKCMWNSIQYILHNVKISPCQNSPATSSPTMKTSSPTTDTWCIKVTPLRSIYQDLGAVFFAFTVSEFSGVRWLLFLYQHPSRLRGRREFPSLHQATFNVHSASRPTSMEMTMIPPHETDTRITAELCELVCIKCLWLYKNVSLIFYTLPQWVSDGFTATRVKFMMLHICWCWNSFHEVQDTSTYKKSVTVIENIQNYPIISSTFEYRSLST